MAGDLDFRESVVVVNFPDESNAYEALKKEQEETQAALRREAAARQRADDASAALRKEQDETEAALRGEAIQRDRAEANLHDARKLLAYLTRIGVEDLANKPDSQELRKRLVRIAIATNDPKMH